MTTDLSNLAWGIINLFERLEAVRRERDELKQEAKNLAVIIDELATDETLSAYIEGLHEELGAQRAAFRDESARLSAACVIFEGEGAVHALRAGATRLADLAASNPVTRPRLDESEEVVIQTDPTP